MTGVITDRQALAPTAVAQDMVHRDGQIDALRTALKSLAAGAPGEHVCISGPSGSGTITLAQYVADQLTDATGHVTPGM